MRIFRQLRAPGWASILCLALAVHSVAAQQAPLTVPVLLDTSEPLGVLYVAERQSRNEAFAREFAGLVGVAIAGAIYNERERDFSARLQAAVGSEFDRVATLRETIAEVFTEQSQYVSLEFPSADLLDGGQPRFDRIDINRFPYVLVLSESAGLATPATLLGSLAARSAATLTLYDTTSETVVVSEFVDGLGPPSDEMNAALDDAAHFRAGYPQAVRAMAYSAFWRLNGKDAFFRMAQGTAAEERFPSVAGVLAEWLSRFEYVQHVPRGWVTPATDSGYMFRAEPRRDRDQLGIVTDIDILVKELGQDFSSLEPYVELRLRRLNNLGWNAESISGVPVLDVPGEWLAYRLDEPRGGHAIFLHRRIGDLVVSHQIIVLEQDPEPLLTSYGEDILGYIAESEVVLFQ